MNSKVRRGLVASAAGLLGAVALVASAVPARGAEPYYRQGGYTSGPTAAPSAPMEKGAADRVNLNTAGMDQLAAVPGIGADFAAAIVKYRDENGSFSSVDDLLKVKGIGVQQLDAFRDRVTVW